MWLDLDQSSIRHSFCNLDVTISKYDVRKLPKRLQLVCFDIAKVFLFETMHEHDSPFKPKEDNRPKSAGLSFAGTGDALLDDATSQIGVDHARIHRASRFPKTRIVNVCLATKAPKRFCLEYGQSLVARGSHNLTIALSTRFVQQENGRETYAASHLASGKAADYFAFANRLPGEDDGVAADAGSGADERGHQRDLVVVLR